MKMFSSSMEKLYQSKFVCSVQEFLKKLLAFCGSSSNLYISMQPISQASWRRTVDTIANHIRRPILDQMRT